MKLRKTNDSVIHTQGTLSSPWCSHRQKDPVPGLGNRQASASAPIGLIRLISVILNDLRYLNKTGFEG